MKRIPRWNTPSSPSPSPPPPRFVAGQRADHRQGAETAAEKLARGKYLVTVAGCNDCHTPWMMGPKGPEPDMTRMLSGHPETAVLPPAPRREGPWIVRHPRPTPRGPARGA